MATLQEVTTAGNITTNPIIVNPISNRYGIDVNAIGTGDGITVSAINGIGIVSQSNNIGIFTSGNIGLQASGNTGVYASGNIAVHAYSYLGKAGVFSIPTSNISNIAEFKKNNINQAYITHNGTIGSNKLYLKSNPGNPDLSAEIAISKNINATTSHIIEDSSIITPPIGADGYGIVDVSTVLNGNNPTTHLHAYQSRLRYNSNTNMPTNNFSSVTSFYSENQVLGAGVVDKVIGFKAVDTYQVFTGKINKQYGILIENQTVGAINYGVWNDTYRNYFKALSIGSDTLDIVNALNVNGSLVATAIKKSGGLSNEYLMADGSVTTVAPLAPLANINGGSVNTAFNNVPYAETISYVYNSSEPNIEINITDNLSITVTGTVNGDSGIVHLYFNSKAIVTLTSRSNLEVTGEEEEMIPVYFVHDGDGLKWYVEESTYVKKTKAEMDALISTYSLVPNTLYRISGVHPSLYDDGTGSGTTIYLRALTSNTLSKEGHGEFYNPKYNQTIDGFGIWQKESTWVIQDILGTFESQEPITANNGATGQLFGNINNNMFFALSGDWSTATSIRGDYSGATASINTVTQAVYNIGDKVIWGGYSWTNVNGLAGASIDILSLNAEWTKDIYDETNYNKAIDIIEYDYENDWINRRYESQHGNNVEYSFADYYYAEFAYSAISVFMFGNGFVGTNGYRGIDNSSVTGGSYFECVDFRGRYMYNTTLKSNGYITDNLFIGNSFLYSNSFINWASLDNNTIIDSSLYGNTLSDSRIQYNTFTESYININALTNSSILSNTLAYGYIYNNILTNNSIIKDNILTNGSIYTNTLNISYIEGNELIQDGRISYNTMTNSSSIQGNILTNNSGIDYNTLTNNSIIHVNYLLNSGKIQSNIMHSSTLNTQNIPIDDLTIGRLIMENARIEQGVTSSSILFDGIIKTAYQRPDGTTKLRYYDNYDLLVIADITD